VDIGVNNEMKPIPLEELISRIKERARNLDEVRIYFTLKKMGVKYFNPETVETIKYIIALHSEGFPYVTTRMLADLRNTRLTCVTTLLHTLGDKGVLSLEYIPYITDRSKLAYKLSRKFLDNFKRKSEKEIEEEETT